MPNEHIKSNNDFKIACGIDTLYYFIETNYDYLDFYDEINEKLMQIDWMPSGLIQIGDLGFYYRGDSKGFSYLSDINGFFRAGFKHKDKQKNLHNILIQLENSGIYTLGIQGCIDYVQSSILGTLTAERHITRADINCFINYDFSQFSPNDFVTKKRKWRIISDEHGSTRRTETIYIGAGSLRLRIYDKKLELKRSDEKQTRMYGYFLHHGFDLSEPISNVEFQIKREEFIKYNIKTLDDFLARAESLFKRFCEDISLRYVYMLTDNEIANGHKNRAKIVEVWQYIHDSFKIAEFHNADKELIQRYKINEPKRAEEILKYKFEELKSWAIKNNVLKKFEEVAPNLKHKDAK